MGPGVKFWRVVFETRMPTYQTKSSVTAKTRTKLITYPLIMQRANKRTTNSYRFLKSARPARRAAATLLLIKEFPAAIAAILKARRAWESPGWRATV